MTPPHLAEAQDSKMMLAVVCSTLQIQFSSVKPFANLGFENCETRCKCQLLPNISDISV